MSIIQSKKNPRTIPSNADLVETIDVRVLLPTSINLNNFVIDFIYILEIVRLITWAYFPKIIRKFAAM